MLTMNQTKKITVAKPPTSWVHESSPLGKSSNSTGGRSKLKAANIIGPSSGVCYPMSENSRTLPSCPAARLLQAAGLLKLCPYSMFLPFDMRRLLAPGGNLLLRRLGVGPGRRRDGVAFGGGQEATAGMGSAFFNDAQ